MEVYGKLLEQVNSMNIELSLIVINAGLVSKGKLINVKAKEIQSLMDVNMYQPTAMLKKFLPGLTKRK